VIEAYYNARFGPILTVSPDAIRIANPGYNRDRGPAIVFSLRVKLRP